MYTVYTLYTLYTIEDEHKVEDYTSTAYTVQLQVEVLASKLQTLGERLKL